MALLTQLGSQGISSGESHSSNIRCWVQMSNSVIQIVQYLQFVSSGLFRVPIASSAMCVLQFDIGGNTDHSVYCLSVRAYGQMPS